MGKKRDTLKRIGDTMVETSTWPAIIDYEEIHKHTKVVDDDDNGEAPWEDCDGYEHEATNMRRVEESSGWWHFDERTKAWVKHWNPHHVAYVGSHDRRLIQISKETAAKWGVAAYAHASGASKQVAAELAAENRRDTIGQLLKWYNEGWRYYGVVCKHPLCEHHGISESVWRVDDEDYADRAVRHEIASQAVYELEKLGYTVINKPSKERTREQKQESLRWKIARNLGFDSPKEYLRWLQKNTRARSS